MSSRAALRALAALFAVSGAAGLIQEVVWSRLLAQTIGHSPQALTAVLACFLGGLALGGALGGRLAPRAASPLRLVAALEVVVAASALCAPWAAALAAAALERFGPAVDTAAGLAALRLAAAAALLLPPTVAMGITLPCLVREAMRRGGGAADAVSLLYGANTLGAAAGAAAGSFALLPLAGSRLALVAAALLNLAAGAAALLLDRSRPAGPAAPHAAPEPDAGAAPAIGSRRGAALAAAGAAGCAGALLQACWIRVAALAFGSTVHALGATLTAYILGLGVGPLLARRALLRAPDPARAAASLLASSGLASLAVLPLMGLVPGLAAALAGRGGGVAALAGVPFLLFFLMMLPATAAQGASFPALAVLADRGTGAPRETGRVYAASSAGAVAGFLLTAHVLMPVVGSRRTLAVAGLALVAAGFALARRRAHAPAPGPLRPRAMALAAAAAAALVALSGPAWNRGILSGGGVLYGSIYRAAGTGVREAIRRRGAILYDREGGDGLVTVRRNPAGILSLQINGKTEASTGADMPTQLLTAHLPLLLHPRPVSVLVIGLASGITAGAAARHPVERLAVFEIAPGVVEAARLFDDANRRVLDDPRLDLRLDDARGGLLVRRDRYDVIASQPSNPWVAGVANLFTEEFYRLARSRLAPGGLLCQWLQAYRLAPDDLKSVVAAFLRVFPEATLWEESPGGGDYFLIGGHAPIRIATRVLRGEDRAEAWEDLRRAGIAGPADLAARFVSGPAGLARLAAGAAPHDDDRLALEARAPLAMFRDDPRAAIELLDRHREPVVGALAADPPPDPVFLRDLDARLRAGRERIAILSELAGTDLLALTDPFLAAGADALRRGAALEALPLLRKAAADTPASATAHLLLAEAYRASALPAAARVSLRAALEADPAMAPAWNLLGRAALEAGEREVARRAFHEAVRRARAPALRAAALNNLGVLLLERGDDAAAEERFRESTGADPGLAAAHANLGLVLKRRGDATGAIEATRRALALDPLNNDARYNLAMLLAEGGRRDAAAAELRRILEIDPDDRSAASALRRLPRPR